MSVHNRIFGTFFVLLGAGIVGTIFGLVSFRIMEEQESLMNTRLTVLAAKFSEMREKRKLKKRLSETTSTSRDSIRTPYETSYKSTKINKPEGSDTISRWLYIKKHFKSTIRKVCQIKPKSENPGDLLDVNMAVYDDEISDLKVTAIGNFLLFLLTLFIGAMSMSSLEGWGFTDAVYWVRSLFFFSFLRFHFTFVISLI